MRAARVMLLGLVLTGCAGAAPRPPSITNPAAPVPVARAPEGTGDAGSVCYLVTDAEITNVMGRPPLMGTGSGFELGGQRFCNWILYLDPVEDVGIVLSRAQSFEEETSIWDDRQSIPGLGEAAYWIPDVNGLYVKKGAYSMYVSVSSETIAPKTAALAVARHAVSRLP